MNVRTLASLLLAALIVTGCTRAPSVPAAAQAPTPVLPSALSQRDPGASLLAAIENARQAINWHDLLAAGGDLNQALGFAQEVLSQINTSLPALQPAGAASDPGPPAALSATLRSPVVEARLLTAKAKLGTGDAPGAVADLEVIQRQVPADRLPRTFALLRAAASLELAKAAASLGLPRLQTQLHCAQVALLAYQGPAHLEDARALAMTFGRYLADERMRRLLLPEELSIWQGMIAQWAGSDHW